MIAIIDYDAGNIRSVEKALKFLGQDVKITRDPEEILSAEKVILPVSWSGAWGRLLAAWEDFSPDGVLMTGLAGGSDRIRVERVGINLCGAAKDNLGKYPNGTESDAKERKICVTVI